MLELIKGFLIAIGQLYYKLINFHLKQPGYDAVHDQAR